MDLIQQMLTYWEKNKLQVGNMKVITRAAIVGMEKEMTVLILWRQHRLDSVSGLIWNERGRGVKDKADYFHIMGLSCAVGTHRRNREAEEESWKKDLWLRHFPSMCKREWGFCREMRKVLHCGSLGCMLSGAVCIASNWERASPHPGRFPGPSSLPHNDPETQLSFFPSHTTTIHFMFQIFSIYAWPCNRPLGSMTLHTLFSFGILLLIISNTRTLQEF